MIAAFFGFIVLCLILLGCAFWIWMIIDCATKEPSEGNDKLVWIVIIVFTQIIGALIYYFVRRPQRIAQLGQ
jgi:prolipoprotein diacylglyceryltransferase